MEIYIVDLLRIIAFKAKVFIIGFLVKCMMDFLVKDSKTVMENIYFVMEIYTKDLINLTKDKEKDYINGNKEQFMRVNSPMIKSIFHLI